jgi:hypothetical protein
MTYLYQPQDPHQRWLNPMPWLRQIKRNSPLTHSRNSEYGPLGRGTTQRRDTCIPDLLNLDIFFLEYLWHVRFWLKGIPDGLLEKIYPMWFLKSWGFLASASRDVCISFRGIKLWNQPWKELNKLVMEGYTDIAVKEDWIWSHQAERNHPGLIIVLRKMKCKYDIQATHR